MIDEQIPPRMTGMIAARNLRIHIDQNPMSAEPRGELQADQPGHPRHEWEQGFRAGRILMHMQQSRNLALGKGIVMLLQAAPEETEAALIAMGRKGGETVCVALMAALLEAEATRYDVDDPETGLAIYGAIKQGMSGEPPQCYIHDLMPLVERVHNLTGMLNAVFRLQGTNTVEMNAGAFRELLRMIQDAAEQDRKAIAQGTQPT